MTLVFQADPALTLLPAIKVWTVTDSEWPSQLSVARTYLDMIWHRDICSIFLLKLFDCLLYHLQTFYGRQPSFSGCAAKIWNALPDSHVVCEAVAWVASLMD